jgi:hypothetical protein
MPNLTGKGILIDFDVKKFVYMANFKRPKQIKKQCYGCPGGFGL